MIPKPKKQPPRSGGGLKRLLFWGAIFAAIFWIAGKIQWEGVSPLKGADRLMGSDVLMKAHKAVFNGGWLPFSGADGRNENADGAGGWKKHTSTDPRPAKPETGAAKNPGRDAPPVVAPKPPANDESVLRAGERNRSQGAETHGPGVADTTPDPKNKNNRSPQKKLDNVTHEDDQALNDLINQVGR